MHQGTLDFERQRTRVTDPVTSRAAAASMKQPAERQRELVLGVLRRAVRPLTGEEIADRCGLSMVQVCRRLPELTQPPAKAAPTEQTRATRSGRQARTWRIVQGG